MLKFLLANRVAVAATALALLVGLHLGYTVGHWQGVDDGRVKQVASAAIVGAKEIVKSSKQRDQIDDHARKIPDTDLDAALSAGGWLRD